MLKPLWKPVCCFLKNIEIDFLYDPVIPIMSILPKVLTSYCRDSCSPIFIATLFTIVREMETAYITVNF